MDFLLLLFALPIATIIIASVLETVLRNPIAVAALTFAIYLIVAFAAFDATFLIYVILYTILAFISAVITRAVINLIHDDDDDDIIDNGNNNNNGNNSNNNGGNSGCGCNNRYYNGKYYR